MKFSCTRNKVKKEIHLNSYKTIYLTSLYKHKNKMYNVKSSDNTDDVLKKKKWLDSLDHRKNNIKDNQLCLMNFCVPNFIASSFRTED